MTKSGSSARSTPEVMRSHIVLMMILPSPSRRFPKVFTRQLWTSTCLCHVSNCRSGDQSIHQLH